MAKVRFSTGREFIWRNSLYEVKRLLPHSLLEVENTVTQERVKIPHLSLYTDLVDGKLQFVGAEQSVAVRKKLPDLSELTDKQRESAEFRLEAIRPLLVDRRTTADVDQRVANIKMAQKRGELIQADISRTTVYRWIALYITSGQDIRSLVDADHKRGGKGKKRIDPTVEKIIADVIEERYMRRTCASIDEVWWEAELRVQEENAHRGKDEQLKKPSRATVGRRVNGIKYPEKITAKRGSKYAKRELRQVGRMNTNLRPLERVEFDHSMSDIVVVDPNDMLPQGRLTITLCIDVATRYPLGLYLGFEEPSYLTVMECLYHAALPKRGVKEKYDLQHEWQAYGLPEMIIVDNGKEFIGKDLKDACNQNGIVLERNHVQSPWMKPIVERMFGTINTGLFHALPGTTFSNIFERGDYDSLRQACITLDDLNKMLYKFLIDIYAERVHHGLGAIPAREWEQRTGDGFFPSVSADPTDLLISLGSIKHRTLRKRGIQFKHLRYNSDDLVSLRTRMQGKYVKFKYHPADLSKIHVYDSDNRIYIEVPSLMPEYTTGLSLWKHRVILKWLNSQKIKPNNAMLAQARRDIQRIVTEAQQRKKKLQTSKKSARWEASGQTPSLQDSSPQPNSQTELPPADPKPTLPPALPDISWDDLDDEGWEVKSSQPSKPWKS